MSNELITCFEEMLRAIAEYEARDPEDGDLYIDDITELRIERFREVLANAKGAMG